MHCEMAAYEPRDPGFAGLHLRFLSGPDIDHLGLSRDDVVDAVQKVLMDHGEGRVVFEPRVHLWPDNDGAGHFNILRGHLSRLDVSGVKIVGDFVANYKRGLPSEFALITLFDPTTGAPQAILDGTMITEARTGAMTAIGARYLARPESRVLGHIGARGTAWWNVTMLDDIFNFDEIRVTSRRPESREKFAERLTEELGKHVKPCATTEETLIGADILVEASRLTQPTVLLRSDWVDPGTLVVPYGTVSAVDIDLVDVMDKVVVDDWREAKAGQLGALRPHVDSGRLSESSVHGEIGEIVSGRVVGRENNTERILFWHRGLSTTDIAVANMAVERAEAVGVGTMLRYH